LWSRANLPNVCYWLYWWYIITDYSEGILFNNICDHVLLYPLYIVTDCTDGILLLIILRESWLIILILWSCATLPDVYCSWLYWWYIITDYTEGILFNNICNDVLLYPMYIVTDCTDGILLLIILRESCLIIFVITCYSTHCIFLLIVLMVYYYWLYWGNLV